MNKAINQDDTSKQHLGLDKAKADVQVRATMTATPLSGDNKAGAEFLKDIQQALDQKLGTVNKSMHQALAATVTLAMIGHQVPSWNKVTLEAAVQKLNEQIGQLEKLNLQQKVGKVQETLDQVGIIPKHTPRK